MNRYTQRFLVASSPVLALITSLASFGVVHAQTVPTLDANFNPVITRTGGLVSALGVQADGKIVLAGAFNAINGMAGNGLARVNADGSVDPSFSAEACCGFGTMTTGIFAPITALTIQKDGKIIIGGSFSMINGVPRNGVARLNTDGSLDTTFDPGTGLTSNSPAGVYVAVAALVLQPDGKLLVGGYFTSINGVARSGVARLNANGSVDTGFDPGTALAIGFPDFGPLTGLALLSNGQVVVAGGFKAFADIPRRGIARMNANGSLDGSFDPFIDQMDGPPSLNGLAVQGDDRMVISGSFFEVDGIVRGGLARLKTDGSLDESFNPNVDTANSESYTVLGLQGDGQIIAYRQFNDTAGTSHRVIARLSPAGVLDPAFSLELAPGQAGRLQVQDIGFQTDGKLLVAGNLSAASDSSHAGVLRASPNGTLDGPFNPQLELGEGADAQVLALAVQPDDKVLVGGAFTQVNGVARNELARLNKDGSLDTSFAPTIQSDQPQSSVSAIAVQGDGKIVVGGVFTTVNGTSRNGIARLNPDGSLDTTFDVGSGTRDDSAGGTIGRVWTLAVQPDGRVLAGGTMTALNGQPVVSLGRLNSNGSADTTFNSGVGSCFTCDPPDVRGLGVLTNGFIVVSGVFNRAGNLFPNGLTRLSTNGSPDLTFVPVITADEQVSAMQVGTDSKTTVAITFPDPAGNGNRTRFVRYNLDGSVDPNFTTNQVVGDGSSAAPVSALSVDSQGRTIIAGQFVSVGGQPRHALARLNLDGTLDTGFDAGSGFGSAILPSPVGSSTSLVTSVGLQANGGILVGGGFASVNNQVRLGLVRFQAGQSSPTGNGPSLSAAARAADGTFSFSLSGTAGQTYGIQASSDLRTWTSIGTVTAAGTPQPFNDPGAKGQAARFYRAVGQ
jgi:uncharacterized delta-60 repeat protein